MSSLKKDVFRFQVLAIFKSCNRICGTFIGLYRNRKTKLGGDRANPFSFEHKGRFSNKKSLSSLPMTAFTIDSLRVEIHFSCSLRVWRRESILASPLISG